MMTYDYWRSRRRRRLPSGLVLLLRVEPLLRLRDDDVLPLPCVRLPRVHVQALLARRPLRVRVLQHPRPEQSGIFIPIFPEE